MKRDHTVRRSLLMKRLASSIFCLTLALALVVPMHRAAAQSGVSISLRIGDRYRGPDLGFTVAPAVVEIQGDAGVYYVQDSDHDIYRYGNIWYMNYDGDWYRASDYSGPWLFVGYQSVPRNVYSVPTQYRRGWSNYRDTHYNWGRSDGSRTAPARTRSTAVTTPYRSRSGSHAVTESPTRTTVAPTTTTRRSRTGSHAVAGNQTRAGVAPVAATRRTAKHGNRAGQSQNQNHGQSQGQDQGHGQDQGKSQDQGRGQNQGH
jgi:hypothetical protein